MALLAREQSLGEPPDFFLNGFEGSLDDNVVDPWAAPDAPFGGHHGPVHLLNLDSPLPTTQGLPGAAVSSSNTPYPLHSQQHLLYPSAGPPLDTAALLRRAQRGAGLPEGTALADPLLQQPMRHWQHAVPPPLAAANGIHDPLSPPWQRAQQPGLVDQQRNSGGTLNGSSAAATMHQSTGADGGLLNANGDHAGAGGRVSRINSSGSGGNSMHSNEATLPEASSGSHGASDQAAQNMERLLATATTEANLGDTGIGKLTPREANRIAQRRYRARQKSKLQESEERVAELTDKLQKLATEKEALAAENAVLEKFLNTEREQHPNRQPQPDQELQTVSSAGSNAANELDVWAIDRGTQRLIDHALRLGAICTFTVGGGAPIKITRKEMEAMEAKAYRPLWRAYIKAFGELLEEAEDDPQAPAAKRLAQLVHEAQQLVGCVQMMILDSKKVNDSANWEGVYCADPGGSPMRIPHWGLTSMPATHPKTRELMRNMSFTPTQEEALLRLRSKYLRNLGILLRRRQELAAALQATLDELPAEKQRQLTQSHQRTTATIAAMRQTLHDEHSCLVQLKLGLLRELDQFQSARLYFCSYPACPDVVALVKCGSSSPNQRLIVSAFGCVAQELDEPPAAEVMRNNANCGADDLEPIYEVDVTMQQQDALVPASVATSAPVAIR